ncbi:MAG: fructose-6-phosphate aldolase [Christensenellaceae bacterium]|nr:fructose-6-phosphate aldolase [Christensenellaceae bacterium]
MLVLIDNADIKEIEMLYNDYPYDGVTTNPTILRAAGENPVKLLKKIYDLIPDGCQLHAQLISESTEKMIEEAHFLLKYIGEDMFIKVPVTKEGMRAIPMLKKEGINITATAIYTSMQAFMAAKAGARYTAPYVNRIDNMGFDGLQVAKNIHDMFRVHGLNADVLAASFKNTHQVESLCRYGIGAVTAAPEVLRALIKHDSTLTAEETFTSDFFKLVNDVEGLHLQKMKETQKD